MACAHCGETKSFDGFLECKDPGTFVFANGYRPRVGDQLRWECLEVEGVPMPARGPRYVFRCEGEGPEGSSKTTGPSDG